MLNQHELQTLHIMCTVGLQTDVAELLDALRYLAQSDKRQFWQWLGQNDKLLQERLKRAKQVLHAKGA